MKALLSNKQHQNDLAGARELVAEAQAACDLAYATSQDCRVWDKARHNLWEANQLLASVERLESVAVFV